MYSEAIDFRAASECFSQYRELTKLDLETLRLLVPYQGHHVPSVGGLL
jgi:ATP-dependent DNA helicase RecG